MQKEMLYVGTWPRTYQSEREDRAFGIYSFTPQADNSSMNFVELTRTRQPGWVTNHPNGRFLYAVNEVSDFEGRAGGGISAFAIDDETGGLTPLNSLRTTSLPCHCKVDATGRYLLVACYGGGTVHLLSLLEDGRLGRECDVRCHSGSSLDTQRQSQPHPHSVNLDPANRFVFVPDLGADRIFVYEFDRDAKRLQPCPVLDIKLAAGSGPRHMVFEPHGCFAYVINELSSTISAFAYDSGVLRELQTRNLMPPDFIGFRSGAEIAMHPSGRFVYATTRSHGSKGVPEEPGLDLIVWCVIDQRFGTLGEPSSVGSGGGIPRSLTFDGTGDRLYVANQGSNNIHIFHIERETGRPVLAGDPVSTPVPVCLCLVPSK